MTGWFWYAIGAALLYGLHQVFTKLASEHISAGLGGFVVEASAALSIFVCFPFGRELWYRYERLQPALKQAAG